LLAGGGRQKKESKTMLLVRKHHQVKCEKVKLLKSLTKKI
jgi:hypothetical protein